MSLLAEAYGALADVVDGLDEADAWRPTGCTGWTVRDLLHHVDLVVHLDAAGPTAAGLAEVRRVVEALLDRQLTGWSDERVALVGTGRATATGEEHRALAGATVPAFT